PREHPPRRRQFAAAGVGAVADAADQLVLLHPLGEVLLVEAADLVVVPDDPVLAAALDAQDHVGDHALGVAGPGVPRAVAVGDAGGAARLVDQAEDLAHRLGLVLALEVRRRRDPFELGVRGDLPGQAARVVAAAVVLGPVVPEAAPLLHAVVD